MFASLVMFTAPQPSYKAERIALYVSAAADILTTRIAIQKGSYEGNPIAAKIVGRKPSTLKLIGLKAVALAVTEWSARNHKKRGEHEYARLLYWITAASAMWVSGWNLQWAWK